jgi:hypothetical protein
MTGRWCRLCLRRPGVSWSEYCLPCIESIRERHQCMDCDSFVDVCIVEGVQPIIVNIEHDSTCVQWRA